MQALEQIAAASFHPGSEGAGGSDAFALACLAFLARPGKRRPILYFQSPAYFRDALWACWRLGIAPVVPPDIQSGNLETMQALGCHALITDIPSAELLTKGNADGGASWEILSIDPMQSLPVDFIVPDPTPLNSSDIALQLFTSGSTGERKLVAKTFAQLGGEVQVIDRLWGDACRDLPIYATVSHQHIYGLLFAVLWPWMTGRPLPRQRIFHWDELAGAATQGAFRLVSSPTHLSLLAQAAPAASWQGCTIFSSGAPLTENAAHDVHALTGIWVHEIYGSTETGGMAWRTQQSEGARSPWTVFPGAQISVDEQGQLWSSSPWSQWQNLHPSGDRAAVLAGGSFVLLGRADRIAKVFGKRVNLGEMEKQLLATSLVEACRVIAPADGDGHLWCALQPAPQGKSLERAALLLALKEHLRTHFEAAQLPRHWYVGALPFDSQGKLTIDNLRAAIASQAFVHDIEWLSLEVGEQCIGARVRVPDNYFYLQGHFPGAPVVPGVCQLRWVVELARKHWPRETWCVAGKVKYSAILLPNREVRLTLERLADGVRFSIADDLRKYSSGRLRVF